MLRARDAMDRDFAWPLDIGSLAAIACVSESTFIRAFKATFPRLVPAGDIGDTDVYGCQQHAPMLDVDIPV